MSKGQPKPLRLQVIPRLVVPVELPRDQDDPEAGYITIEFEIRRQTPDDLTEVLKQTKENYKAYQADKIDGMEYARRSLELLCVEDHWDVLSEYDILYVQQILDHIKDQNEEHKKKHGGKSHSSNSGSPGQVLNSNTSRR